jgi:hypothetical protein
MLAISASALGNRLRRYRVRSGPGSPLRGTHGASGRQN